MPVIPHGGHELGALASDYRALLLRAPEPKHGDKGCIVLHGEGAKRRIHLLELFPGRGVSGRRTVQLDAGAQQELRQGRLPVRYGPEHHHLRCGHGPLQLCQQVPKPGQVAAAAMTSSH